jgi:hypothetical protein
LLDPKPALCATTHLDHHESCNFELLWIASG